ncbi:unnamed protein product [Mesocestoides corti]|uniref:Transmembrane protein 26 n=2 Tax=Mesocestoides corti TaxID=53468 RepID=A0A0R3UI28_MESCO|nr:unnamed protein product [Mesocestoides corti]
MEIPQSGTEDCLLKLGDSERELDSIPDPQSNAVSPPKPPYPVHLAKNCLPQEAGSRSLQEQSTPVLKILSNCSTQDFDSPDMSITRKTSAVDFISYKHSRAVAHDPSANYCLRLCCRSWLGLLKLLIAFRAILARFVFLALTLTLIAMVVKAKNRNVYWLLCFLMLPLLGDLCYSIGIMISPRKGQDKTEKWFNKCLLAYLFCACPPIWIIELHQLQQLNEATDAIMHSQGVIKQGEQIFTKNPWIEAGFIYNKPDENLVIMGEDVESYLTSAALREKNITVEFTPHLLTRVRRSADEASVRFPTQEESLIQAVTLQHYPLKMRVRIMEQLLLLSVIVGRWLLPRFGISRDQLSQLLLINIGNAADILELFEAFNEEAVRSNASLNICILCLWQASLLQFCFNKTATLECKSQALRSMSRSSTINELLNITAQVPSDKLDDGLRRSIRRNTDYDVITQLRILEEQSQSSKHEGSCCGCLRGKPCGRQGMSVCGRIWFGTELWAIFMSLILQDLPFLALRLTLVMHFNVRSYSNIFFTCKNSLLILLQVFRSTVILGEFRRQWNNPNADIPMILVS